MRDLRLSLKRSNLTFVITSFLRVIRICSVLIDDCIFLILDMKEHDDRSKGAATRTKRGNYHDSFVGKENPRYNRNEGQNNSSHSRLQGILRGHISFFPLKIDDAEK